MSARSVVGVPGISLARTSLLGVSLLGIGLSANAGPSPASAQSAVPNPVPALIAFEPAVAFRLSQAAVGNPTGDHHFVDRKGNRVNLDDYRGRPLLVSLIYTSCYHSCSVLTRYLRNIVDIAQEALGEKTFSVVTIGFDTANDTPARMATYARQQGVRSSRWAFLSGDAATIDLLAQELGFSYAASPKGYDHLAQVTVLDSQGRVYRQIYGDRFEPPTLVEPLKELVWGLEPTPSSLAHWITNVRAFCTIYDPNTGRYRFDYSIFVGMIVGGLCLSCVALFIVRAWRESVTVTPQ